MSLRHASLDLSLSCGPCIRPIVTSMIMQHEQEGGSGHSQRAVAFLCISAHDLFSQRPTAPRLVQAKPPIISAFPCSTLLKMPVSQERTEPESRSQIAGWAVRCAHPGCTCLPPSQWLPDGPPPWMRREKSYLPPSFFFFSPLLLLFLCSLLSALRSTPALQSPLRRRHHSKRSSPRRTPTGAYLPSRQHSTCTRCLRAQLSLSQ